MCEFCEPDKKNKCKPLVKRFDSINGYEKIELKHAFLAKLCPIVTNGIYRQESLAYFFMHK